MLGLFYGLCLEEILQASAHRKLTIKLEIDVQPPAGSQLQWPRPLSW